MNNLLSVGRTVALLDQMRVVVREFAAREEALNREFRNLTEAAQARAKDELDRETQQADSERNELRARFTSMLDHARAKFSVRERRLADAYGATRRRALEWVQQTEDRRKYAVQKGTLDAERGETDSLARNDAALADFQARLAQNRESFSQTEAAAFKTLRGYRRLQKRLLREAVLAPEDASADHNQILEKLQCLAAEAAHDLSALQENFLLRFFRIAPLWCWFVLALVSAFGLPFAVARLNLGPWTAQQAYATSAIGFAFVLGLFALGTRARPLAIRLTDALSRGRAHHNLALQKGQSWHAGETERIKQERRGRVHTLREDWQKALDEAAQARESLPAHIEDKWRRIRARNDQFLRARLERIENEQKTTLEHFEAKARGRQETLSEKHRQNAARLQAQYEDNWATLASDWTKTIAPLWGSLSAADEAAIAHFRSWTSPVWQNWIAPESFQNSALFGKLEVNISKYAATLPQDPRLALPQPVLLLPLVLTHPREGSVLFETAAAGKAPVIAAVNNIIFRLLATSPIGKLSFTIFDPIGLGENFAGVTHLADYEANLLNGRIWTQPDQIEERLSDLNEHMEKVIQMYLRNEYETIAEYNLAAGNIAEKYHFLVLADFPANFSEAALRRLLRIVSTGARCGVYTLIHFDSRHGAPPETLLDELRKNSIWIKHTGNQFALVHPPASPAKVLLDSPPPPEVGNAFLERVGERSRGSNRVEVPFGQVAPPPQAIWSLDTAEEVRVPIGRSGPNKLEYLALGRGTRQHALVAGKTGSGKSTLFHVIVTNAALWCSPDQIEFYLVDFKKGVEFKPYGTRHLPHARVVAIESDREFALSVLQRLDEELRRRGDLFRRAGVQDLAGYRKAAPGVAMPRSLLIIDEFQEFFVEEDRIAQGAAMLLDRIVRQGRAFGIHVVLGSQTLGGVYTLARSTIGQMVVRIALQCNEADAYLIMDENNAAPRLLSRPGEGIYNDMAGAVEGNSPFQAVWLPDADRDAALRTVRERADRSGRNFPGPITFEGNAPADFRENKSFVELLRSRPAQPPENARVWLGAPNSIKEPTQAVFSRKSGSNLLMVGQREEAVSALLSISLLCLSSQFPSGTARFVIFDSAAPDSPERSYLENALRVIPHEVVLGNTDLAGAINSVANELTRRAEQGASDAPRIFLLIRGLENFKKFRPEDEFAFSAERSEGPNPATQFTKIYTEGPSHGIHVIAAIDTYNNVSRFFGRKGLSEFEMRVLFQMSASDSASLCDDPKASQLGLYRALLFNEHEGTLETFRPYASLEPEWLQTLALK